ncbi:Acylamidase [Alphaproteobacteria bacterium SO-S41]|nr:Acylamidase [Alphaproteobacteria bacterium SO-S41]
MSRTVVEIAEGVRSGRLSARTVLAEAFERLEARNPALNAFVMLDREGAERSAAEVDAKVARGEDPGLLAGVPFGVKDMDDAIGMRTTKGSWFLKDDAPKTADFPHIARLRAAGAVPIGKTAVCEFGLYGTTDSLLWGTTRNPWDVSKTPGGSSGGSSAAVAAGIVPFATGSDAGGSIRGPAAYCGLVGLKPSHGRIAKHNGFSNFSVVGDLAATVGDAARLLDVAAGPDDRDRQSLPPVSYSYEGIIETLDVRGLKAVWSPDMGYAAVDPEAAALARGAAERLIAAAGLVERPGGVVFSNILRPWAVIMLSPLREDFTRQGILPDGYDKLAPSTKFMLNRSAEREGVPTLAESWAALHRLEKEAAAFFQDNDVLLSLTTACPAYGADELAPTVIGGRDATATSVQPFCYLANSCWNPSISVPAGVTAAGLPVGLLITVRRHRDDIALRLARVLERESGFPALPFSGRP